MYDIKYFFYVLISSYRLLWSSLKSLQSQNACTTTKPDLLGKGSTNDYNQQLFLVIQILNCVYSQVITRFHQRSPGARINKNSCNVLLTWEASNKSSVVWRDPSPLWTNIIQHIMELLPINTIIMITQSIILVSTYELNSLKKSC